MDETPWTQVNIAFPGQDPRERERQAVDHLLDTPSGRFAELAVITELLHAATRGDHLALAEPLRRRVSLLLGRTVPALS